MNQTQNQATLAGKLQAEAAAKAIKAQQEADARMALAQAWDAAGFTGKQPHLLTAGGIYGDVGTLFFEKVGPDDLAELMRAFPAIPRLQYSHNNTRYFHPVGGRVVPENPSELQELDGYEIEVSGGKGYDSFRAHWSAMVGDQQASFRVDLRRVSFLHPTVYRRAVVIGGELIRYEGTSELRWPEGRDLRAMVLHEVVFANKYASSNDSKGDIRLRGTGLLQLAEAWEAEANRRGTETRAAFELDYAMVEAAGPLSAEMLAVQVERERADYEAKKGGLRAGTLEQTAALATPHALADKAVAEKHWIAYAARYGISTEYQTYFSHYDWAKSYLRRADLYEVPVTDAMRESATGGIAADVTTYTYGSRWL